MRTKRLNVAESGDSAALHGSSSVASGRIELDSRCPKMAVSATSSQSIHGRETRGRRDDESCGVRRQAGREQLAGSFDVQQISVQQSGSSGRQEVCPNANRQIHGSQDRQNSGELITKVGSLREHVCCLRSDSGAGFSERTTLVVQS